MTANVARGLLLFGLASSASGLFAQTKAPPAPIVDNERVRVWLNDAPATAPRGDRVIVSINQAGAFATFAPLSKGINAPVVGGGMIPGGNATPATSAASRTLYVELKDGGTPAMTNKSGYPNAFPRPGVKQLLDNARVTVWEYRWTPGEPTPMHFHDKDVVVLYLEDGALQSTTPAGEKTVNEYKPGMIKFNLRDRIHSESLVRGTERAVMVELK